MPLITSKEIITQVNSLLNDGGFIRWPKSELLGYFNSAQKAIVLRRPDAYTVDIDDFDCVAGTKQSIPADALRLIDIPRNLVSGNAVRGPYDRTVLDQNYPSWFSGNSALSAELYIYDERNPKTFYLYPGVVASTKLTAVFSMAPPVTSEADNEADQVIALDDIYENAIIEYIFYKCYSKDAEYAANTNKASMHLSAFKAQLGEKSQADSAMAGKKVTD